MAKRVRVASHFSEHLQDAQTHADRRQIFEGEDYFHELLKLLKLPHMVRNKFFELRSLHPGISPEDTFRVLLPDFPVRLVIAPMQQLKTVFRLDHLCSKHATALSQYYSRRKLQFGAELAGRPMAMLMRLPYMDASDMFVFHDTNIDELRIIDVDGPMFALWHEEDGKRYRVFLQLARCYFSWEPMAQEIGLSLSKFGYGVGD